jgi:hypothetical protein
MNEAYQWYRQSIIDRQRKSMTYILFQAMFSFVAFAGNGLGPASFGFVELSLGFRFVNWILFGISGLFTLVVIAVCKETRGEPVTSGILFL